MPVIPDQSSPVERLTAQNLAALPGLAHGFFTRRGGTSSGIYAALNCGPGSDDTPGDVAKNRELVTQTLGARELLTLYQIHSASAVVVDAPLPANQPRPRADALVTRAPGLALGALSADCTPVLFADPEARIVAAAHSGWRGATGGILEATIDAMVNLGAARSAIRAAVGPCINQSAYEVGHDFKARILSLSPEYETFFTTFELNGKPHFDLPGFVAAKLQRAGLHHIEMKAKCTWAHPEQFFSYRRTRANNETDYGRQISAIVLI